MLHRNARSVGGFGPPAAPSYTFSTNRNFVAVGDSITQGVGTTTPYCGLVGAYFGVTDWNFGHGGFTWEQLSSASSEVDAVLASPPQTLCMFAGTNDLGEGESPATTYAALLSYRSARIAAGWDPTRMIFPTMLPRYDVTEDNRSAYNALIVSGASTYGYAVARLDLDPNIGVAGAETNTTYYNTDDIHPTNAGQSIIASIIEAVMA